jgi:hypothetical protein
VACGVWRVACGVWRVACGVWRVACGVWRVACGVVWCGGVPRALAQLLFLGFVISSFSFISLLDLAQPLALCGQEPVILT